MSALLRKERGVRAEREAANPQASDEELLRQFVAERSDLAFAQLVTRHNALVMSVCRRVLGREQDAEDAFQATFLVLARKATSLRRAGSLSAWLYKTAYRIALRARTAAARRRELPLEGEAMIATDTLSAFATRHDQSALDEELHRLPDKYRLPLFLCCVEGLSRNDAARRLGWSLSSLKGRVERGRRLLRRRLMLRGVSLGAALTLLVHAQKTAQASVAPSLVVSTVQAGMQYAAGQTVIGYVSQNAFSLANGSFHLMSLTCSKVVLCSLMVVGLLAWGASWLPAPAIAGSNEADGQVLVLQADDTGPSLPVTLAAFVADDERESPRRSPEAEAGARRSPEAEAGPRRSPEADAGPRRSPEAEAGPRRSPEAEAGPRRSPEADAGPRRSPEADARRGLENFRPASEREAALYRMILQLQREVAQLRQAIGRGASGERAMSDRPPVRGDTPSSAHPADWERTKAGGVFKAYDKNGDMVVSLDEWLAMTNGNINEERRRLQTTRFREAEPSGDDRFTPQEFIYWYTKGRFENTAEGRRSPASDGDTVRRGPRDGEAERRGPRDGDAERRGLRDGEGDARE